MLFVFLYFSANAAPVARGIPHLNADNWPSAKQIAEALSSLHQKRHGVDNLWHSLSDEDKEIVSPPPSR